MVDGKPVYTRNLAQVNLAKLGQDTEAKFRIDWHLVALPTIQEQSLTDPLFVFRQWLARMLILRPMPALILGGSNSADETLQPTPQVTNFGGWFSGLLAYAPSAYSRIDKYLKQVMPDLKDIKNPVVGADSRSLVVQFSNEQGSMNLQDGERSQPGGRPFRCHAPEIHLRDVLDSTRFRLRFLALPYNCAHRWP